MQTISKTVEELLSFSKKILFYISENKDIHEKIMIYGYGYEKMREGKVILETAEELNNRHFKETGATENFTESFIEMWKKVNETYTRHIKIAKIALANNKSAWYDLGLNNPRKKSITGWVNQAKHFYNVALSSGKIIEAMENYGIDLDKLLEEQYSIKLLEQDLVQFLKEHGESKELRVRRDEALDHLSDWIEELMLVADIAFEGRDDLRELFLLQRVSTENNF